MLRQFHFEWEMKNSSSSHSPLRIPPHPNTPLSVPDTTPLLPNQDAPDRPEKPSSDWDFRLSAVISSATDAGTDAIGVVEFDHSDSLLATGGIARRIRIYNAEKLISPNQDRIATVLHHNDACDYYICTPAKLSSLKWKPGSDSRVIGSGDYDGVVMEYDLEKRVPIFERDEHGGRRVWSIDYSGSDPNLGASGSDDGTMQMWDTRCDMGECVSSVQPDRVSCSPVCCLEFNPFGGLIVAVGCADRRIYGYDVRRMADPVFVLNGHEKAVTYTRFLDLKTVVSSSIDGNLMMWDAEDRRVIRRYRGHVNSRRFVGLSIWRNGGLFSCGSENNHVFVYDKRWGDPIWVRGFEPAACERSFVSGVCWRQSGDERCTLVAGGSDGVLQVFGGERKS